MLNRAARYFPILRELEKHVGTTDLLLDIGSGPLGIGEFWQHPFVGTDIVFADRPRRPMRPVVSSGTRLPFLDASFDATVVSDVLEHVVPDTRPQVVAEVLRITRRVAIFAFPCGPKAHELDRRLHEDYLRRGLAPPSWLREHMLYPFPTEDLFRSTPADWQKKVLPNESLGFHYWMMLREMRSTVNRLFRLSLRLAPRVVEGLLRCCDGEPSYRKIFVLTRQAGR